jgi:acetyl-CoA acyltransferase
MSATYIYDAVRTPFGRFGKTLSGVRPDDLAATVMGALVERTGIEPGRIDDVIFGAANQAGEDNRNVARFGSLLAGFPSSVPAVTVNRLCGSSMEAVIQGSRAIAAGDAELILAGGTESMSRAPYVLEKPTRAFPATDQKLWNTAIGWRMVNPQLPSAWTISNGESAEKLAKIYALSREAQDAFAARSHALAAKAWAEGIYDSEIVQVDGYELSRDEGIRSEVSISSLAKLDTAFVDGGTVTAGNSSPLSDGASAILLGAENSLPAEPLARITGRGVYANDPDMFGIAPVEAANQALTRAGRRWSDVDFVELNEAFASQSLACLHHWSDLNPESLNIHGGALAIGHPLGASGGRLIGHAAHELARRGGGVAVVALCIGVGQGLAIVLER